MDQTPPSWLVKPILASVGPLHYYIYEILEIGLQCTNRTGMVPFTRNPGFVGREHTLSQVMERIMPLGKAHSRVALYGLGGVG